MSFFDDASLVFLPSGQAGKDGKAYSMKPTNGDGDFTFSRGSNLTATRVDSNGLIEKGRENLLTYSNRFDLWNIKNVTSGHAGYDGTNDAWLQSGASRLQRNISYSSGVYTASFYVKAGFSNYVQIRIGSSSTIIARFELIGNGTNLLNIGTFHTSIEPVSNGWYRISISFNSDVTQFRIQPENDSSGTITADSSVYVQHAQLEIGLTSTEYIESGATTGLAGLLEDSPRFDYSGGASCPSLLLEPSRTNLFEQSEYYEDTFWEAASAGGGSAPIVTTNYATSPEGVQNATRIQFDASSSGSSSDRSRIRTTITIPTDNVDYTQSFYIKSTNGTEQKISFLMDNSQQQIMTITSEWQRFDATRQHTGATGIYGLDLRSNFASTSDILVYAGQLEEGSYPTSYIPNHSGGSVTREADSCSDAGTSSTFNDAEGVLYLEASAIDNGSSEKAIAINDGTTNNRINIRIVNNTIKGLVILGGSLVCNISYTATSVITSNKIAFKYKRNDFALWLNGVEVGTDTSGSIFPADTLNELSFDYGGASAFFYGNVEQVLYFPTALSDVELTALTS